MDWSADKDYHGRDIGADDTEASNLPGQYWLSKTTGQVVFDGDVRICSSLPDRCEFVLTSSPVNCRPSVIVV